MAPNIEVEIKIMVRDPRVLYTWLNENAEHVGMREQTDIYYDPPGRSFITDNKGVQTADEWFRLRTSDQAQVCYKHWHRDHQGKSTYADEIETVVDNVDQMKIILQKLGFTQTAKIVKKRTSYRYKDFVIACDDVADLGFFVEIEYGGDLEPSEAKKAIYALIKTMEVSGYHEIDAGYPILFWNPSLIPHD
jgi:predicted adenylyl cyclase CyaB